MIYSSTLFDMTKTNISNSKRKLPLSVKPPEPDKTLFIHDHTVPMTVHCACRATTLFQISKLDFGIYKQFSGLNF